MLRGNAGGRALTSAVTSACSVSSNTIAAVVAAEMEAAMWRKLAIFSGVFGSAVNLPLPTFSQTQNPPWDTWYGPWFMWSGGWSWWWVCPLIMLLMILAMMFFCRFMASGRHCD